MLSLQEGQNSPLRHCFIINTILNYWHFGLVLAENSVLHIPSLGGTYMHVTTFINMYVELTLLCLNNVEVQLGLHLVIVGVTVFQASHAC